MARSLLWTLVSGTRQLLAVQLFAGVIAVALAGWTLVVTNQAIQERDRLRERVVQLENELGARGVVVPPAAPTVAGDNVYPPEIGVMRQAASESALNPAQLLTDVFAPPPELNALVLHVRSEADRAAAAELSEALQTEAGLTVVISVMAPRDGRASAYAYYDGRQSRAAAALVARFNDAARNAGIPQWSAQPRALALPAQGEFTAERLDILLPPLPAAPASAPAP